MKTLRDVYNAFLCKVNEDDWANCYSEEDLEWFTKDWRSFLESAIPYFKFPRCSLEIDEEKECFKDEFFGNAEIEVLAKSSASATLSLGTSSSATTTFANAASVGTTAKSIAKFYTADAAQKLFVTPSVAGLTINLTLKITNLK